MFAALDDWVWTPLHKRQGRLHADPENIDSSTICRGKIVSKEHNYEIFYFVCLCFKLLWTKASAK